MNCQDVIVARGDCAKYNKKKSPFAIHQSHTGKLKGSVCRSVEGVVRLKRILMSVALKVTNSHTQVCHSGIDSDGTTTQ